LFKGKRGYSYSSHFPRSSCVISKRRGIYDIQVVSFRENQKRYNIKAWEANIAKSKRMAKELKKVCEEYFHSLDKESLGLGKEDIFKS
jgi:hypothetical protein